MSCNIQIIRKAEAKISTWSGGTTTQLYIYPENAIYGERNFKWRLSSAKVAADESVFTPLPGISRILMVIEGELYIEHQGHYGTTLRAFEKDCFSGDWVTKSVGKATDFNLMTDKECSGSMEAFCLDTGEVKKLFFDHKGNSQNHFSSAADAFYFIGGDVKASIDGMGRQDMHDGDLVMVTRAADEGANPMELENVCNKKVNIIRTIIYY